jgi:thiol-disulfide isomerase/thioredoxin
MAATETIQIPLGFQAPEFSLPDTISGKKLSLSELKGEKATVVMFICNHCPYVIHIREVMINIANEYLNKGIKFIAISSNDIVNYPDDAPEKMKQLGMELKFPFPYLYDENQNVAKAYHAACTPDFNVFDANLKCVYRGQMDDSRPKNNIPVTGKDLRNVLNNIIENKPISNFQIPSIGCNIKWKKE